MFLQMKVLVMSRTGKGILTVFLGNAVSSVLGIVFTVFAARILAPSDWGVVAAVMSFIPMLVAFSDFGISSAVFQFSSSRWGTKTEGLAIIFYRATLALRFISLVAVSSLLIIFSSQLALLILSSSDSVLIFLATLGLVGTSLMEFQVVLVQSRQKWNAAAFLMVSASLLRVAFLVYLFMTGLVDVVNVLLIYTGSSLLVFLLSLAWQREIPGFCTGWQILLRKFISFSIWMSGNKIISAISSRIDVLILLYIAGSYDTGVYAAASRLVMGVPLLAGSFATVLAARFASLSDVVEIRKFFKKSLLLSSVLAIGVLFGILVAPYVTYFLGDEYEQSTRILQWLLVAIIPLVLSVPAVNVLIYYFKKPKIVTYMSIVQVLIIVGVNFYMIPKIGVFAPVLALGIAQYLTTAITYFYALYYLRLEKPVFLHSGGK